MKLVDLKVKDYLDILKSNEPAPGGGSVSALTGAQGVSLMLMVIDLTVGRERYKEFEEVCQAARMEGLELYEEFVQAIDNDTEAYRKVSSAFKLPKETEEDNIKRGKAIADAMILATEVPLKTMEIANKTVNVLKTLVGKSNPNAASDLGVSALCLIDAVSSAWLNVKINLPSVKEEDKKLKMEETARMLLENTRKIGEEIYTEVEKGI